MSLQFLIAVAAAAKQERLRRRATTVAVPAADGGVTADRILLWNGTGSQVHLDLWRRSEEAPRRYDSDTVFLVLTVGLWEVYRGRRLWRAPGDVAFHRAGANFAVELESDRSYTNGAKPAVLVLTRGKP